MVMLGGTFSAAERPSRLIDEKGCVRARRDLCRDLSQVVVHRLGVAARHDERRALAGLRADSPEDISGRGSLVLGALGRVPRLAHRRVMLFF